MSGWLQEKEPRAGATISRDRHFSVLKNRKKEIIGMGEKGHYLVKDYRGFTIWPPSDFKEIYTALEEG